jgi:hypothetical protein
MSRLQPCEIYNIHCYKSGTCQPSLVLSILNDTDLKSKIADKGHKTDPYYFQMSYFKFSLRLGLAPTVFDVQFEDQSGLLYAYVSSPFTRCS